MLAAPERRECAVVAMPTLRRMTPELVAVADALVALSVPERVEVLRQAFARTETAAHNQLSSHWFVGVATMYHGPGVDDQDRWTVAAVAYPDREYYDGGYRPEQDLFEDGTCERCGTPVESTAKGTAARSGDI